MKTYMQKLFIYSTLSLVLIAACSKDKFETKPTIEIKSLSSTQIPLQAPLQIDLEFTDKQGDLDSVCLYKVRVNSVVKTERKANVFEWKLPTFPEKSKGTIRAPFDYNNDLVAAVTPSTQTDAPNGYEPDTIIFKIVVKDKSGNVSDTAVTDRIVIERKP